MKIIKEGNGYFYIDDYYGKELYIESDENQKLPTYVEVRTEKDKECYACVDFTNLNTVADLLASITEYCYGVHEQVSDIAEILNIDYEYNKARAGERK